MQLAEVFTRLIGEDLPVGFRGYDGSTAGPSAGVPVVELRDPIALRYLFTARRRDLGVARAYVTGALDVTGDLYSAMRVLRPARLDLSWGEALTLIRGLGGIRLLRRPPTPAIEARLSGRRHTRERDAAAIAHHYDRSDDFFALILGESMTYTCAFFDEPSTPLAQAQLAKHELVARQLNLQAGMRLLDVGCGWGTFVRYAAARHGVKALGVTLSRQQAAWAQRAIAAEGLAGLAEVRCLDYRDVPEADFDAIASIEMVEHIGRKNLAGYFRLLVLQPWIASSELVESLLVVRGSGLRLAASAPL